MKGLYINYRGGGQIGENSKRAIKGGFYPVTELSAGTNFHCELKDKHVNSFDLHQVVSDHKRPPPHNFGTVCKCRETGWRLTSRHEAGWDCLKIHIMQKMN